MHQLAVEQRRELGVRAQWHVGDVTWGLRQHEGREDEWTIRVWKDGETTVAWSWLKGDRGHLEFDVRRDRLDLLDEILVEPEARTAAACEDDQEVLAALARHGFAREGADMNRHGPRLHFLARDLSGAPGRLTLPDGFRCRTVEPGDLAERVAIHREVWAPSRVTESSFANVQSSWPYRASLDCVVEAPDGRFAAYALMWPDDENGVGELEPVGVREEFRRRGLGAAVCMFALRRLHDEAEGRRSCIARTTPPARCTSRSASGATRRSSATRAETPTGRVPRTPSRASRGRRP